MAKTNSDGTFMLMEASDEDNEVRAAARIGERWKSSVIKFAPMSPIDWYVVQQNRVKAVAEIKCRKHKSDTYPTVYLSVRKWHGLMLSEHGMGVGGFFVAGFTDGIWSIRVDKVDARRFKLAGRYDRGLPSDIEPMIEVPIDEMTCVETYPEIKP
jgi:hypothetical protein